MLIVHQYPFVPFIERISSRYMIPKWRLHFLLFPSLAFISMAKFSQMKAAIYLFLEICRFTPFFCFFLSPFFTPFFCNCSSPPSPTVYNETVTWKKPEFVKNYGTELSYKPLSYFWEISISLFKLLLLLVFCKC